MSPAMSSLATASFSDVGASVCFRAIALWRHARPARAAQDFVRRRWQSLRRAETARSRVGQPGADDRPATGRRCARYPGRIAQAGADRSPSSPDFEGFRSRARDGERSPDRAVARHLSTGAGVFQQACGRRRQDRSGDSFRQSPRAICRFAGAARSDRRTGSAAGRDAVFASHAGGQQTLRHAGDARISA